MTRDRTRTSPLRGSNSPPRHPGATAADNVYERSFVAGQSEPFPPRRYPPPGALRNDSEEARYPGERSVSGPRKGGISPTKIEVTHAGYAPHPVIGRPNPLETACRVDDLLREIEDLKIQRDHFAKEAEMERAKNRELEDEFHVLRGLIAENSKPIGYEENLALKHQFQHEREMRIHAENDVNRLRAQLADALAASHRDTLNLKKALSDMQATNQQNLATIYEKGDQNLEQMQ